MTVSKSRLIFISSERVDIIGKGWMFFLIFLSFHFFYIFSFMTRVRCLKFHFAIIQKADLYATLHQRLWMCQRRSWRFCISHQKIYVLELLKEADQYKKLQVWNLIGSGWSESGIFPDFVCISFHELGSDSPISKWAGILVLLSNVDQ